jgi:hypothetical protein
MPIIMLPHGFVDKNETHATFREISKRRGDMLVAHLLFKLKPRHSSSAPWRLTANLQKQLAFRIVRGNCPIKSA